MTMKRFQFKQALSLLLLLGMLANVASAQKSDNVYDKFRNRTYSNEPYKISEADEIKFAGEVHQQFINPPRAQAGQEQAQPLRLLEGTPINDYINRLGQNLARNSKRPNLPWRFFVVNDKSVNAFATLGGYVYIHTGLIAQVQNESQLVSVIGHEIGHIVGRHGLENVKRSQSWKTQLGTLAAVLGGAVIGGEAGAQLGSLLVGGYLMKHGRDAEREADYLGLYNMQQTGYNTTGMGEMFAILAQLSQGGGGGLGSVLASHPDPRERLQNTQVEIQQRIPESAQRGTRDTDDFRRIKSGLPALNTSSPTANNNPSTMDGVRPRRPRTGSSSSSQSTSGSRPRPRQ